MTDVYSMSRLASIHDFLIALSADHIVKTMTSKYTEEQHGLALRSSMRGEPLLQHMNHKAAFFVVDCYPHGERGFFVE